MNIQTAVRRIMLPGVAAIIVAASAGGVGTTYASSEAVIAESRAAESKTCTTEYGINWIWPDVSTNLREYWDWARRGFTGRVPGHVWVQFPVPYNSSTDSLKGGLQSVAFFGNFDNGQHARFGFNRSSGNPFGFRLVKKRNC